MAFEYSVFVSLVAVALLVLMMPLFAFLGTGWKRKRADILDGLSDTARLCYFKMFCRDGKTLSAKEAYDKLDKTYDRDYGRHRFFWPGALLFAVGGVSLYLALGNAFVGQALIPKTMILVDVGMVGVASITGAYMWIIDDLISRARRMDLSPADVHWCVLRFTIAIPMGYSFAQLFASSAGGAIAFALGAFPIATVKKLLQRGVTEKLGLGDPGPSASDDLVTKLQGVNPTIAMRLANEDITTITQVAYCDPIRLTMRSNLTFNVVTDLMNQALAWEYLAEGMDKIRMFGMRGAVEISHLMVELDSKNKAISASAGAVLATVAQALGQPEHTVVNVFSEVARDPFTDYLNSIWE